MRQAKGLPQYFLHLIVLLALLARHSIAPYHGQGLVAAQKKFGFFKQASPDLENIALETLEKQQQVIENLRALSSPTSPSDQEIENNKDIKKKRLSKGKDIENLLKAAEAKSPSGTKESKKSTGHEDDIIHNFDHADNEAYDDIVWYDGPHRDDEEEHEHGDEEHEEEHDGYHHDHDEQGVENDMPSEGAKQVQHQEEKTDIKSSPDSQLTLENPRQYGHSDHGFTGSFQHSGADILVGPISPIEFCLRLKHECESTCREFRSGVEHLSVTCEAGSVAELLFWGKCCQIGQEHRAHKLSTKLEDDVVDHHILWQQKRHQQIQGQQDNEERQSK
ncbi:hypothetical protein BGX26_005498 [Mortierella sp. AD094]|nr:hypothetical protein BGX26_005498 [Mortierella sp. AD094]